MISTVSPGSVYLGQRPTPHISPSRRRASGAGGRSSDPTRPCPRSRRAAYGIHIAPRARRRRRRRRAPVRPTLDERGQIRPGEDEARSRTNCRAVNKWCRAGGGERSYSDDSTVFFPRFSLLSLSFRLKPAEAPLA